MNSNNLKFKGQPVLEISNASKLKWDTITLQRALLVDKIAEFLRDLFPEEIKNIDDIVLREGINSPSLAVTVVSFHKKLYESEKFLAFYTFIITNGYHLLLAKDRAFRNKAKIISAKSLFELELAINKFLIGKQSINCSIQKIDVGFMSIVIFK